VEFKIIGHIEQTDIIAVGNDIRNLAYLQKTYGHGRWRKLKGLRRLNYLMGLLGVLSFTGMRLMALVEKTSK
jgi:hypothetical protein